MSLTPSHPRVMSPALGASIKLTPSLSPFAGARTTPRFPSRSARTEAALALRTVIGATTTTANACDSLPTGRCFAYTAGAAAVVATVDHDHAISQRFYRARPTTNPINSSASIYGGPSTPTQNESRNRAAATLRDTSLGPSPHASPAANDWADSPSTKAWTAKEKIKAATCVSLSPDGKFLATGYRPRVLIFSTAPDAPCDTPLTALSEHSFGVNCVAFSPDSRYLASLGSSQDGFLYIWSINARTGAATLHASNKCVSNINKMTWMGNKLITVGTRHIKVWKVDELNNTATIRPSKARQSDMFSSSTHKALPGRNCTLGNLQDAIFTSVCQVAPNKAVVASDKGDLCLIDETEKDSPFSRLASAGFAVSSMAVDDRGRLHLSNCHGELKTLDISDLLEKSSPPPSPTARAPSPTPSSGTCEQVGAVVCLADYIVTIDAQRAICLSHLAADSPSHDKASIGDVIHSLPAHGDSVLGVDVLTQPNDLDAAYYTWAAGGTIIFWGQDGSAKRLLQITIEQIDGPDSTSNELRTVRASSDASFLVTGDKLGVLRIMDCKTQQSLFESKAHAGEITRIAIMEGESSTIVACASRDRTVQIFARDNNNTWDLMQTLDEHAGAVNGVMFSRDGTRLVSSSSDRSVVVRELMSRQENGDTIRAFVMLRAVMLKATPVSMAWDVDQEDVLLISTMDRQVHKYDLRNGQCMSSFRASDTDGGDAVVLSSLAHIPRGWGSPLIAGVSSTDKSIRIYDEAGTLIARDWGHTEGVTDIAFVSAAEPQTNGSGERSLVTVAVDGTIFVWGLALQSPHRHDSSRSVDLSATPTPANSDFLATKPPLRRVISQSELARFPRSSDEGRTTPTGNRSPKLRKKSSKSSFQGSRLDASGSTRENRLNTKSSQTTLRRVRNRSPSPPSPRQPQTAKSSTAESKTRSKAALNEFGSLNASTEVLCRNLRTYRKRLANSTETLSPELAKEVERELATTARTVGERVTTKEMDEPAMLKLLDQYSDRLVAMLDEKIAASVALRLRRDSEVGSKSASSDCETPISLNGEEICTDTPSPKTIG